MGKALVTIETGPGEFHEHVAVHLAAEQTAAGRCQFRNALGIVALVLRDEADAVAWSNAHEGGTEIHHAAGAVIDHRHSPLPGGGGSCGKRQCRQTKNPETSFHKRTPTGKFLAFVLT